MPYWTLADLLHSPLSWLYEECQLRGIHWTNCSCISLFLWGCRLYTEQFAYAIFWQFALLSLRPMQALFLQPCIPLQVKQRVETNNEHELNYMSSCGKARVEYIAGREKYWTQSIEFLHPYCYKLFFGELVGWPDWLVGDSAAFCTSMACGLCSNMLDGEARFSKWMGGIRRVPLLCQFFPLNFVSPVIAFPSCRLCIMSCVHVNQSSIYPSLNVPYVTVTQYNLGGQKRYLSLLHYSHFISHRVSVSPTLCSARLKTLQALP